MPRIAAAPFRDDGLAVVRVDQLGGASLNNGRLVGTAMHVVSVRKVRKSSTDEWGSANRGECHCCELAHSTNNEIDSA